jgi:hypothetical protein
MTPSYIATVVIRNVLYEMLAIEKILYGPMTNPIGPKAVRPNIVTFLFLLAALRSLS